MAINNETFKYLLKDKTTTATGNSTEGNGGDVKTFRAEVVGTGAVSATVIIDGSDAGETWTEQNTFTLSGTTSDSAVWATANSLPKWRARITAISGTGANVNVTMCGN